MEKPLQLLVGNLTARPELLVVAFLSSMTGDLKSGLSRGGAVTDCFSSVSGDRVFFDVMNLRCGA